MQLLIPSTLRSIAVLAALTLATLLALPTSLRSATCAEVRKHISDLNGQLTLDQTLLHQWCRNTLSDQCKQQGPGMQAVIKDLGDEITAARLQLITACAQQPPPAPHGPPTLKVTDVSPDTPHGAAAAGAASGGRIHTLLLDPSSGNSVLYGASTNAGVWKSADAGRTWAQASIGLRNTNPLLSNNVLALDANSPKRLLYATAYDDGRVPRPANGVVVSPFGGLYVSTDGAASWRHAELSPAPGTIGGLCPGAPGDIASVAFSSGRPFVAAPCGLFTNDDPNLADGQWKALPNLPAALGTPIIAPNSYGNTLFACSGNLVFRSPDRGQSWGTPMNLGAGDTCWGLSVVPSSQAAPDTVAVIHVNSADVRQVSILDFTSPSTTSLGFNAVANNAGSGVPGIFTVRRASAPAGDMRPGSGYDVYAADGFLFHVYAPEASRSGKPPWKPLLGANGTLHADSWSMAFPSTYDPAGFVCTGFVSNDGGVFENNSQAFAFVFPPDPPQPGLRKPGPPPVAVGCDPSGGWVAAMSGLHTLASWGIAGVSQAAPCPARETACPMLYVANGDNDVWAVTQNGAVSGPLLDRLGDAGEVHVDPAFPGQVVTTRQLSASVVVSADGSPPGPGASGADITPRATLPNNKTVGLFSGAAAGPLNPGLTQVMALDGEGGLAPLYFAIQGRGDMTQPDSVIMSSVNPPTGQGWVPVETGQAVGFFPHFAVAEIRSTGGLRNPVLWILTTSGAVYKGAVTGGKVSEWTQVHGIGKGGSVFVNPYDASRAWVMDLADQTIKSTPDGGQSWTPMPAMKAIATNNGEYRFDCGWSSDAGGYDFFAWTCSLGWMAFNRNHPNIVVAALFPGGVGYSNDGGKTWRPLPGATSDPPEILPVRQNLRGLPVSVWYDDNPVTGTPSIYVALHGKGMIRVDGNFNALPP
jgi:hypothetical protein